MLKVLYMYQGGKNKPVVDILVTLSLALIQVYTADVPTGFHVYCIKVQLSWAIAYLRIKNTNF